MARLDFHSVNTGFSWADMTPLYKIVEGVMIAFCFNSDAAVRVVCSLAGNSKAVG
jgi:hypothetical protein